MDDLDPNFPMSQTWRQCPRCAGTGETIEPTLDARGSSQRPYGGLWS
jgi:hypothetical protein